MVQNLLTAAAVRGAAARMLADARAGGLQHWTFDERALPQIAAFVARITRQNYPDLKIPFHARWRHEELVLDKWFTLQALSSRADALARVQALLGHADFDIRNPNRARSLLAAFPGNQVRFHDAGGGGYRFLADAILRLDPVNSQTAARLVSPLGQWRRQDGGRQAHMRAALRAILALPGLSRGTFEQASRALGE